MYTPVDVSYRPAGVTPELICMVRYIFLALVRWEDKIREIAHGVTYMTCLSRVTARNKLLAAPVLQFRNGSGRYYIICGDTQWDYQTIYKYTSVHAWGIFPRKFHVPHNAANGKLSILCMYPEYCGPLPRTIINRRRFCGHYESG